MRRNNGKWTIERGFTDLTSQNLQSSSELQTLRALKHGHWGSRQCWQFHKRAASGARTSSHPGRGGRDTRSITQHRAKYAWLSGIGGREHEVEWIFSILERLHYPHLSCTGNLVDT